MTSPPAHARTIFISYAREDEELVLPIVRLLRAAGAKVFVDQENIPYGDNWERVLMEQLGEAERVLVFWSKSAAESKWVRREYVTAIREGVRVVPVPLDPTPLSAELSGLRALMALVPLIHQARQRSRPFLLWQYAPLILLVIGIAVSTTLFYATFQAYGQEEMDRFGVPLRALAVFAAFALLGIKPFLAIVKREVKKTQLQDSIYKIVFSANVEMDERKDELEGL